MSRRRGGTTQSVTCHVRSSLDLPFFKITTHLSLEPNSAVPMHCLLGPHKTKGITLKKIWHSILSKFSYCLFINLVLIYSYTRIESFLLREERIFFLYYLGGGLIKIN